jgi:hypothetical protein
MRDERLTVFKMGPDILRLEESPETKPGGCPSSAPVRDNIKNVQLKASRYHLNLGEEVEETCHCKTYFNG